MLPVARDILHLQVLSDELASPRDTQGTVRTNSQFLQVFGFVLYVYQLSLLCALNEKQHTLLCAVYFNFTIFTHTCSSDSCSAFVTLKMVFVIWDNKYQISRIRYSLSSTEACCFRSQLLSAYTHNDTMQTWFPGVSSPPSQMKARNL